MGVWSDNSEWWAMLLEAEEGDVLFGSYEAGPNEGGFHFRFEGVGRETLTGIRFASGNGEHIAGSFNEVSLIGVFNGESSLNYHGSNPSFEWGGLLRPTSHGGMSTPYLRESTRSAPRLFTQREVTRDDNIKGIISSLGGTTVGSQICGPARALCGAIVGAVSGQYGGGAFFEGWDTYGRQLHDKYLTVSGYDLTYRLTPTRLYPNQVE
ncbi:MAG: hypothetical protein GY943_17100 [Chloroflexi bacterium]|nr:hypothetical protein [Chloroflexota bacterium]